MPRKLTGCCGGFANIAKTALICATLFAGMAVASIRAKADDINWRQFEGASIVRAYDIHPYADAVAAQLSEFEKLTGIKVRPELYPDDAYWDRLTPIARSYRVHDFVVKDGKLDTCLDTPESIAFRART